MKKEIAFFDFDGTITTKDTLLEFLKFNKGHFRFYWGFLINLPYLIAYKLKIITNHAAKEKILHFFLRNTPAETFKQNCDSFSKNVLPQLIRSSAMEEIKRLKGKNITVVVVSASPENWIEGWARQNELELIASRLEILNNKITGRLLGKNCHGNEKVNRIKEIFDLAQCKVIAAYGDTKGDKAMLNLAVKKYYKHFD